RGAVERALRLPVHVRIGGRPNDRDPAVRLGLAGDPTGGGVVGASARENAIAERPVAHPGTESRAEPAAKEGVAQAPAHQEPVHRRTAVSVPARAAPAVPIAAATVR